MMAMLILIVIAFLAGFPPTGIFSAGSEVVSNEKYGAWPWA
jgi:hypothetical protein